MDNSEPIAKGLKQTVGEYYEEIKAELEKLEARNAEVGENEWRTRRIQTLRKRLKSLE